MGCDPTAFAMRGDTFVYADHIPEVLAQFVAASEDVKRLAGAVDPELEKCGLDISNSEGYLARAVGFAKIPRGQSWFPEDVQRMAQTARWPDPAAIPPDLLWAYWSARRFFELCAANDLGIQLS